MAIKEVQFDRVFKVLEDQLNEVDHYCIVDSLMKEIDYNTVKQQLKRSKLSWMPLNKH